MGREMISKLFQNCGCDYAGVLAALLLTYSAFVTCGALKCLVTKKRIKYSTGIGCRCSNAHSHSFPYSPGDTCTTNNRFFLPENRGLLQVFATNRPAAKWPILQMQE